ncbi:MAG: SOUL family heme-binding protein [Planctomycetota bacterium]
MSHSTTRCTWILCLALSGVGLLAGCSIFGIRNYEEAEYQLVSKDGDIELRRYSDSVLVETLVAGEYDEAGNTAFRRLFAYISGANESKRAVDMTTPVFVEKQGAPLRVAQPMLAEETATGWRMSFVLPKEFTLATAPQPNDPLIQLRALSGATVASLRFSGRMNEQRISEHARQLEAWLPTQSLSASSPIRSAAYDPPFTLPFLRRNEVQVEVSAGGREEWH